MENNQPEHLLDILSKEAAIINGYQLQILGLTKYREQVEQKYQQGVYEYIIASKLFSDTTWTLITDMEFDIYSYAVLTTENETIKNKITTILNNAHISKIHIKKHDTEVTIETQWPNNKTRIDLKISYKLNNERDTILKNLGITKYRIKNPRPRIKQTYTLIEI